MAIRVLLQSALRGTALSVALVAGVACSDDGGNAEPQVDAVTAAPDGTITINATDNRFHTKELIITAGAPVILTFNNQGAAVHNFKVTNVKSTDGKEIGTELLAGKKSETITFTVGKPGSYTFQCDTHPAEMRGKLTVQ
jgi:plastocyanin